MQKTLIWSALVGALSLGSAMAELKLPSIFGSNMVLQRDAEVRVWGWDNAGQDVTVEFAGQSVSGKAGDDGKWTVTLAALEASAENRTLTVKGSSEAALENVLVGEVWVCSGQSNMQWSVSQSYDADLESLQAKFDHIRIISVPQVGTQELQNDFEGSWESVNPENVLHFSAVGYYFGRTLHQTLDVPIGLIDNAWGGSAAEAWVQRDVLAANEIYKPYLDQWAEKEATLEERLADFNERIFPAWQEKAKAAREAGTQVPRAPRSPEFEMSGQHRPGNLWNGVLNPTIGYGIRGAIWYQGESNSSRAWNYRELFPLMISEWRKAWGQGDFPFYWVQLADFRNESDAPMDSGWAELREAQTMTLDRLENTGEAVIIDIGEGNDIHPRNKKDVGFRLARLALNHDYGIEIASDSPRYESHEIAGSKANVTFQNVGGGMDTFDVAQTVGFEVAGEDQVFHKATGKVTGKNTIQVWSDAVSAPVAIRYGWADNPVLNVLSQEGLPLTPFRTDDWRTLTKPE